MVRVTFSRAVPLVVLAATVTVSGCTDNAVGPTQGQFGTASGSATLATDDSGSDSSGPPPASSAPTAKAAPVQTPSPTAPKILPPTQPPVPSATLPKAPAPAATADVATRKPVSLPQYVPPDFSQSGIALTVAGTRYAAGETISTSSQAAPELTGFTAYLLVSGADGTISPAAVGTVEQGGRFTLSFRPTGTVRLISAVAQAGVTPQDPFILDNVIARSSVVKIRPQ